MICYAGESECYMICFVMAESNTIFYSKLIRDEGAWTHPMNKYMYDVCSWMWQLKVCNSLLRLALWRR